jgi:YD repeat-containing protein
MKKLFLLLFAFLHASIFSQQLPVVIPQSPEAASLSKYCEYPVGSFTGIPSISVPLYTISSGDISIPIELNYHAGGFRVTEEADWVGLGWSLSTSYVISQSVKGADDFTGSKGDGTNVGLSYLTAPKIIDIMGGGSSGDFGGLCDLSATNRGQNGFICGGGLYLGDFSFCRSNWATVDGEILNYSNYASTTFDWEPDVFSLSIPGYSGKFILGQDSTVYFLEKQDLKVEKNDNGFLVTTSEGVQYEFNKKSITAVNSYNQEVSAEWHLTRIISRKNPGKKLRFVYKEGDWIQQFSYSESAIVQSVTTDYIVQKSPITASMYKETYVDSIIYDEGYVVFYPKINGRLDIKNADLLDSIRIFNYENNPVKTFVFKTGYFNASYAGGGYFTNLALSFTYLDTTMRYRLRLDTLIEQNGNKDKKKYIFQYSNIMLPRKDSYSQDHWGFYNGAYNSQLIPSFEGELHYEEIPEGYFPITVYQNLDGANRNSNANYMSACMLKDIIYPTGGSTTFEFEGNTYNNILSEYNSSYYYDDYYKCFDILCRPNGEPIITADSMTFPQDAIEILEPSIVMAQFPWNYSSNPPPCLSSTSTNWFDITIGGVDQNGHSTQFSGRYYFNDPDQNGIEDNPNCYTIDSYQDLTGKLFKIYGPVNLSVTLDNQSRYQSKRVEFSFYCKIKRPISSLPVTEKNTGGLRVKKIVHYDGTSHDNDIVKTYTYSNGILKTPLRYYHMVGGSYYNDHNKYMFSSSAKNSLSYIQGSHIGYSMVTESLGENEESGRTEFGFHNYENKIFEQLYRPPSVPNSSQYLYDGKLMYNKSYDNLGNPVSKTVNHYNLLEENIIKGICQYGSDGDVSCARYGEGSFYYYPIYTRWEAMTGTDEIIYDRNNPAHFNTINKIYGYIGKKHIKPVYIGKTMSDSSLQLTVNKYAGDYSFSEYENDLENCYADYENQLDSCTNVFWDCVSATSEYDSCRTVVNNKWHELYNEVYRIFIVFVDSEKAHIEARRYANRQYYHIYHSCLQNNDTCDYYGDLCKQSVKNQFSNCLQNYSAVYANYLYNLDDNARIIYDLGQEAPGTLVESVIYRNGKVVDGTLNHFQRVGTSILPDKTLTLKVSPALNFNMSSITNHTFLNDNRYEPRISIDYYDKGNIKEARKSDDYPTSYLWGYNENYPVAKIENLAYTALPGLLKTNISLLQNYTTMNNPSSRSSLKSLNTNIRANLPANVLVSTYTYIPLVGLTSETNPNNITTYYEYDKLGRLSLIRDNDGNIIKTFKYHYKQ